MDPILAPAIAFHDIAGRPIAVRHRPAPAEAPTILFLPGYASDMDGAKAVAIDAYAAAHGVGCLRLDYSGTGLSPGDFGAGTLEGWLDEVVGLVDHLPPHRRLVVAGSSMGGWLALHLALRRPERVAGVLGIAAAPDFTEWGFGAADKALLASQDRLERPNRYGPEPSVIHRGFTVTAPLAIE